MIVTGSEPASSYRWRWQVLVVVLIAEAMDILDTTTVNVAGPSVRRDIGGGTGLVQWLSAAYTIAFAVLLITGGRLGDRYGRRRMFLLGATGFTVASVACGLSPDPGLLIAFRVVQGAFGAVLLPQGMGLLIASFSDEDRGRAFSAYAPVLSLAAIVGPLIAGALIRWDLFGTGWRLIFFVNLALGGIAIASGHRYLPRDGDDSLERLDARGVAIVATATFCLVFPLIQGQALGWPGWSFVLLLGGIAGGGVFAFHERRTDAPLIAPALLRRRTYLTGAAVALAFFAAAAGIMLVLSLYAQYGLRYSALGAGLLITPVAAGNVAGALIAMRLVPRIGGRATIQANLSVAVAGLVSLAGTAGLSGAQGTGPGGLMLAGPVLALGFGLGGSITPLFSTIITGITPAETGSASGSLGAIQQLAGSIGVASIATAYTVTGHPAARGLAITALATAAVLAAGAALTFLLPPSAPRDSRN